MPWTHFCRLSSIFMNLFPARFAESQAKTIARRMLQRKLSICSLLVQGVRTSCCQTSVLQTENHNTGCDLTGNCPRVTSMSGPNQRATVRSRWVARKVGSLSFSPARRPTSFVGRMTEAKVHADQGVVLHTRWISRARCQDEPAV